MFSPRNFKRVERDAFQATSLDMLCVPAEKARVQGLTRASAGDTAIHIEPGMLRSLVLPWSGAQFSYLPNPSETKENRANERNR
jgi:hypothetical protein